MFVLKFDTKSCLRVLQRLNIIAKEAKSLQQIHENMQKARVLLYELRIN